MNKFLKHALALIFVALFTFAAIGSSSSDSEKKEQETGIADNIADSEEEKATDSDKKLGVYEVDILSCRLANNYKGEKAVIVKYAFTNNGDKAASFDLSLTDKVYQNGVECDKAYSMSSSANYDSSNKSKSIKPGTTLELEAAYILNDATTDIEVEVGELLSWDDTVISKTFTIAK